MSSKAGQKIQAIPMSDRIIVRRVEHQEKHGSLYIPEVAQDKPQEGEVVAVGPGRLLENGQRGSIFLSIGDRIIFGKYSGAEIKIGDETLLVMREDDVLVRLA